MPAEFSAGADLRTALADGAPDALNAGDGSQHDAIVVTAARQLKQQGCTVIALAQFSLARARQAVTDAVNLPVLTTPKCAVRRLAA